MSRTDTVNLVASYRADQYTYTVSTRTNVGMKELVLIRQICLVHTTQKSSSVDDVREDIRDWIYSKFGSQGMKKRVLAI